MGKNMRYRMLDVRIWCDEKFRSLTPLKPSGQARVVRSDCGVREEMLNNKGDINE